MYRSAPLFVSFQAFLPAYVLPGGVPVFLLKRHAAPIAVLLSASLLLFVVLQIYFPRARVLSALSGRINTYALPTFIIDAGHGGIDGGAVAADGTVEKGINLSIAFKLKTILTTLGYPIIMTRESDCLINDDGLTSVKSCKTSDIKNRLKILENAPNGILLSIHQNKYSAAKYSGTQVFYSPGNPESHYLATTLQNVVRQNVQPENTRVEKQSGSEIYLLYHATRPAVMIECGFISNPDELEKLKSDSYQQLIAYAVAVGVLQYLAVRTEQ